MMRTILSLTLVGAVAVASARHERPLSVSTNIVSMHMRGDTTRVAYAVTNAPTSTAGLFVFTVDAPAPPLSVEGPQATRQWHVTRRIAGYSVASWSFIETEFGAGKDVAPLAY